MPNATVDDTDARRPFGRTAVEAHRVLRLRQVRHPRRLAVAWSPRMRAYLAKNPAQKVRLEGHADERGSREYNIGLGERRGQAVRRALLLQGVAEVQLSHGELRRGTSGGRGQRRAGLCAQSPRRDRVPEVTARGSLMNTSLRWQWPLAVACDRRLRDLAGRRSGADPHERSRHAPAAHRARA